MEAGEGGSELPAYLGQLWIIGVLMYMLYFSALFFTFILFYFFFFLSTLFSISAEVKHNHFVDEI